MHAKKFVDLELTKTTQFSTYSNIYRVEAMIKKYFVMFIIIFSPSFMYADSEFSKRSENITREETSGFLGGAILGGAAGGPPGILLGAGIGALLGDNWQKIKGRTKTLELALKESNLTLAVTQNELVSLRERYELAKLETDRYKVSNAKELTLSLIHISEPTRPY